MSISLTLLFSIWTLITTPRFSMGYFIHCLVRWVRFISTLPPASVLSWTLFSLAGRMVVLPALSTEMYLTWMMALVSNSDGALGRWILRMDCNTRRIKSNDFLIFLYLPSQDLFSRQEPSRLIWSTRLNSQDGLVLKNKNYYSKVMCGLQEFYVTNSYRKSVSDYISFHNPDAKSPRSSQLGNAQFVLRCVWWV